MSKRTIFTAVLLGLLATAVFSAPVLVHEWHLDNNYTDTSGSGNTGSAQGNP